jgi:arylsulfatase A-like enzyme
MSLNTFSRREFIRTAGMGSIVLALTKGLKAANSGSTATGKPNVLFILADDMRPDCIGALGNPNIRTPNLDKLVERGMSFTHAYCLGSNSGAVCTPSRTMILTGRSVFHISNGGFGNSCNDSFVPWAKAMSAGGYETFHLGKKGNSFLPGMEAFDTCLYTEGIGASQHEVSSQKTADRIIEYLRGRNPAKPFFIYMAPPVPHDPRVAPKEFMDQYDPAKIPLPENFLPVHPFDNGEMTVRDEKLAPWPRTPEIVKRHLADDYACITCLDHHIGRVIDVLKELKQFDNTIIIFAADNGLSIGEHGLFGKQNLYEYGGMHVPLVIAGPDIPHGKTGVFTYLYDLYPTVCELTGTTIPPEVESKSLVSVITGKSAKVLDYVFTAYRNCQRAVRDERWKLIRYPRINKNQLFDLEKDPHETNNLADKPEHADRVKEMMVILGKLQKEYDDSCPLTSDNPDDPAWSPEKAKESEKIDSMRLKRKKKDPKK